VAAAEDIMAKFWIQFVGTKDTGKTSLLESVTRELVKRGRRVSYVKHTHEDPRIDGAETDTARLAAAGATTSILVGPSSTTVFRAEGDEPLDAVSFREALPGEIVLAEGFKTTPGPKIALAGGELDITSLEGVVAIVGDPPPEHSGTVFRSNQIREICDLIEKLGTFPDEQVWAARLFVDGRELPLNTFVQDMMAATLRGMCSSLREGDAEQTLEVRCRIVPRRKETGARDPGID
jgi:molybdopterin-guanine dinucleotide biosynthesis protein B